VPLPPPPPEPKPWAARLAAGEFQPILDEALAEGLDSSYRRRSSDELAGLSDAARYLGRREIARDALLAQRRRFAASEHARRAAFRLGVMAEESGDLDEAVRWYEAYLSEAAGGPYAPEAHGRKMLAVERREGPAAARPLAEEHRRQFTQGPYLVHALRILQAR
jgi:hypothetical protein